MSAIKYLGVDVSKKTVAELEREAARHPPIMEVFFEVKGDTVMLYF